MNYQVLDALFEGCQVIGFDWHYIYVNEAAARHGHSTPAALVGRRVNDVYPGFEQTPIGADIRRCLEEGASVQRDNLFTYLDGSTGWFQLRLQPVPEGALIMSWDVSETRALAEQQRLTAMQYQKIIETTSEGVLTLDASGTLTFANQQFAQMLGYSAAEIQGRPIFDFMDSESKKDAAVKLERRLKQVAETHTHRFLHRDGREIWLSVSANPLLGEDGKAVGSIALVRDITVQREADEVRNRLAAIIESSSDAIVAKTLQGVVTDWNRGAHRLFGYSAEEAVGQNITMVIPSDRLHEEQSIIERISRGERVSQFETLRRHKDGSLIDVAVVVSPIRDASNRIVGASKIVRDLSETRKAEAAVREAEAQLRQAQKMESVGNLAGGVAHDFNNLLSVILSYSELALSDLRPGEPLREELAEIQSAANKAAVLTGQLLAFSRQQILKPRVLDLNQIVAGLVKILGRVVGEHISLTVLDAPKLGRIHADPGQIEQVLMNLVVNARDAMPDGGQLTIETANAELDAAYARVHHGVNPGNYLMLAVTDTGTGMDAATQARIFDPFFTTKELGKGTGLGLATVYGIVKQSGGHIWLYSELGHGTTFKVYFPTTEQVGESEATAEPPVNSLRGTETILMVEDEEAVRVAMRTILRRQGYNVLEASNGGEALLICEQFAARIHLLLTDVIMPRMTGKQLAARLTALRPDLPVLFVSGFTENSIVHHGVLDSGIHFLQKPITPQALARRVREVLDAKGQEVGQ